MNEKYWTILIGVFIVMEKRQAKIFIEVNQVKIDQVLQETAEKMEIQREEKRSLSC